jgi:xanthine/uracil/vitamin C permease (AzgA family)
MDVPVKKALAGCLVAAGLVALLAVVRVLSVILGIVPDSIKLAVVSLIFLELMFSWVCRCSCLAYALPRVSNTRRAALSS